MFGSTRYFGLHKVLWTVSIVMVGVICATAAHVGADGIDASATDVRQNPDNTPQSTAGPGAVVQRVIVQFADGSEQVIAPAATSATVPGSPTSAPILPNSPEPSPPITADHFGVLLSDAIAPATIHVSAVDLRLSAGTLLTTRYQWSFGDAGSRYDQLEGFNAAHTYDRPGQYTITLALSDAAGATQQLQASVRVQPDAHAPIYVAADGNDAALGADPQHPVRSIARAAQLLRPRTEVLLRRGDSFPMTQTWRIMHEDVLIGAYGADAQRPTLMWLGDAHSATMIDPDRACRDLVIQDITFDSPAEQGDQTAVHGQGTNLTVRRCQFLHVGNGVNANGKPNGLLVQDCMAPLAANGIKGYFVWLEGTDAAILGNTVANSNREHCIRMWGYDRALVANNDLTNLDRRAQGDPLDDAKGCIVCQAGSRAYIANNHTHDGGIGVGPLGAPDNQRDRQSQTYWVVVENNVLDNTGTGADPGANDVMFRNNLIRRDHGGGFTIKGYDEGYHRQVEHVTIANNTVIATGRECTFLRLTGRALDLSVINNLYVAPSLAVGGGASFAGLSSADATMNSFTRIANNVWSAPPSRSGVMGINWIEGRGLLSADAWNALPMVSGDRFLPVMELNDQGVPTASGDAATIEGAGAAVPGVWTDRLGTRRGGPRWSAGALEVPR